MGVKALAVALLLVGCGKVEQPTVQVVPGQPTPAPTIVSAPAQVNLPGPPTLTSAGHALILEFETDGQSGYDQHPEWPKGSSGVTIGVGYDLGYYSKSVINSDWNQVQPQPRARLVAVAGLTGSRAQQQLDTVRDIIIAWELALGVFDRVDVAREFASAKHAMPGFTDLRPNCQAALISLGFNRGWSMTGANRAEMRDIRDNGVPRRDYELMASDERKMERIWRGTQIERGMTRRREAEAKLILTP